MEASSTTQPTENGPPRKKTKVTMEKGNVSQAVAVDFIKALLTSADQGDQLYGLQMLTNQFKTKGGALYGKLTEAGVITQLVRLLACTDSRAQVMALDALLEVCDASSQNCTAAQEDPNESCPCEHCAASRANSGAVVSSGAIPELVKLLATTKNPTIIQNCLRCLLYITKDINNRDAVLQQGIIPCLVERAENCLKINRRSSRCSRGSRTSNNKIAAQIFRLFNQLCRSEQNVPLDLATVKDFLPVLSRVLSDFQDPETLERGCGAIVRLTFAIANSELAAVEAGVCNRLVELMLHPDPDVAWFALLATANICNGNGVCKTEVLKCGVLPNLVQLLNSSPDDDDKEIIYRLITNLCGSDNDNSNVSDHIQQIIDAQLFPGLVQAVKEGPVEVMLQATSALCSVALHDGGSIEQIEYLIEQGALEALSHQLTLSTDPEILGQKLDALECILDRVTRNGSNTDAGTRMLNAGAVPELIKLLAETKNPTVAQDCISCLHSITRDIQNPDVVLQHGVIPMLVKWAEHCLHVNLGPSTGGTLEENECSGTANDVLINRILRFLCDLCKLSNNPVNWALLDFLPVLTRILSEFRIVDILNLGCDVINQLDCSNEKVQLAISKSGVCTGLVELIMHPNETVAESARAATTSITHRSLICSKEVLKCGVLTKLVQLLKRSRNVDNLERVYMLISNLSKHPAHIQQIIDAQLIPGMIEAAKGDEAKVRLQATKAICSIIKADRGTGEQVDYLVEQGALEALCHHLTLSTADKTLTKNLGGLAFILERVKDQTDKLSRWKERIEKCGGLTQIEILQTHKNLDVYQKAYDLADKYFDCQLRKLKVRATYIEIED